MEAAAERHGVDANTLEAVIFLESAGRPDVIAGPTPEDPKTAGARVPRGGYTSKLSTRALQGKRIGLYGPGWRTTWGELSPETQELYAQAVDNLRAQGATVVEDPFAGTGFADLARAESGYDARGGEFAAYEMDQYLRDLGPRSPFTGLAELLAYAEANGFSDWVLDMLAAGDPEEVPDLTEFHELRDQYLAIFNRVMAEHDLDALVFPQQTHEIGPIYGGSVPATTVSEINIAQLPGVVVPDGAYASGKPFNLIFVGKKWTEAKLLGYAYDYDQAYDGRIVNRHLATTPGPVAP